MRINFFEKALLNNPVRGWIFRHFEARRLLEAGGKTRGGLALEIGCGRGWGTEFVLDAFKADRVHAFDLDPRMITGARRKLRAHGEKVALWIGSATHIAAMNNVYDYVFDFGAIHHVINWPGALTEAFRVLKPGGRFYIEEILEKYIVHPVFRRLLDHPQQNRFDDYQFNKALEQSGFNVVHSNKFMDLYAWFVADKPI
jgi:ubiquinone/menaquinone biosynthesis C-methylase UbiE